MIQDMGALSKLIFGGDPDILEPPYPGNDCKPTVLEVGMTEADLSEKNLGEGGAIIISAWLTYKDNGLMTKLDFSSNILCAEGGKCLATALKGNHVMKELDISCNYLAEDSNEVPCMSGVVAIANAIPDIGALSKLTFSGGIQGVYGWEEGDAVTLESGMTEANFSNKKLGVPGAMIISAWFSSGKDNGTLLSVNLLKNFVSIVQAQALACMLKEHPTLKSLCGNSGNETELDMSGKMCGAGDAILLASEIAGNGALLLLSLKSNGLLNKESGEVVAGALNVNSILTELDISTNYDEYNSNSQDGAGFAQELAVGLASSGAMTKFDISNCSLGAEGVKLVAEALKKATRPCLSSISLPISLGAYPRMVLLICQVLLSLLLPSRI
jgi:hypothetical protein